MVILGMVKKVTFFFVAFICKDLTLIFGMFISMLKDVDWIASMKLTIHTTRTLDAKPVELR